MEAADFFPWENGSVDYQCYWEIEACACADTSGFQLVGTKILNKFATRKASRKDIGIKNLHFI